MIPLLATLLGGRWRSGGLRSNSTQSIVSDEITISWNIEDVQDVRPDLTDQQARRILRYCESEHDATIGINWDVLQFWANTLYPLDTEVSS